MTDFHKLLIVKINKMIKKKTGGIFMVVYVIYNIRLYTDSKKAVFCVLPPTAGFMSFMQVSKGNLNENLNAYRAIYVCSIMSLTIRAGLYLSVLSNLIVIVL